MVAYNDVRDAMRSGDVIACVEPNSFFGWLIRWATRGRYAHVGLVWRVGNRIFMLEDRFKQGVCIRSLSDVGEFDWISFEKDWESGMEDRALSLLQKPYGIWTALKIGLRRIGVYLNINHTDPVCSLYNGWVLGMPDNVVTPTEIVDVLLFNGAKIQTVKV